MAARQAMMMAIPRAALMLLRSKRSCLPDFASCEMVVSINRNGSFGIDLRTLLER
jgi:hypothetical protein